MNKFKIIAEAGVNHNGDLNIAKKLAMVAKECGADIVKFQTASLEALITAEAPMAEYQKENMTQKETQMEMLRSLLLSYDYFVKLSDYCKSINIEFLSTPFDLKSIDFLSSIGCTKWKIPSGEITNLPYLVKIASLHQSVILSTGMSTLEEVERAVNLLKTGGTDDITILHCTTEYPTPYVDVNLKAMITLKNKFKTLVGYSDHTLGIEIPIAAVGMGASIIEKHFTLDRNMKEPYHRASLEPEELKKMVQKIRNVESALGDGVKVPSIPELSNRSVVRKSIVASKEIKEGELFTEDNITTKRSGNGISPMEWYQIVWKKAGRDYKSDELIRRERKCIE